MQAPDNNSMGFAFIFATLGQMSASIIDDMEAQMVDFSTNPAPSESDLQVFQANMEIFKIDSEVLSNTIKVYGDVCETTAQNVK